MTGPRISVALTGLGRGYVIATMPAPDPYTSGQVLVVGQVREETSDHRPTHWRAWLWPKASGELHTTQHCDAVDATTPEQLGERLQRRAGKEGLWWQRSS